MKKNEEQSELKQRAYKNILDYQSLVERDPYRLSYHIMPPVGLLNDPNGFVYFNGQYHIFYQWNPFRTKHGAKFWAHYTSDDLVHWEMAPIALAPDQWYDKDGCYSGSAVIYKNRLYVFYTGNVKNGDVRYAYQCLAVSDDGIHFDKKGPVIETPAGYTSHFRDPKVFLKQDKWFMVLGAQTSVKTGEAVMYSSADLINWHFRGSLAGSGHHGLGSFGYMWECPDLFTLNDRDVLLVCPQGLKPQGKNFQNIYQSGYFSGQVDYKTLSFIHGDFKELDKGFDFYAPQTTVDGMGRRLLFGWMGNTEPETTKQPTQKYEWIHALTIPRYLEFKHNQVYQHPVPELQTLRKNERSHHDIIIENEWYWTLPGIQGQVFELHVDINEWNAELLSIQIGNSVIWYDPTKQTFAFQRLSFKDENTMETRQCELKQLTELTIFKDISSIEIFVNQGEYVFTSRVFDTNPNIAQDIQFGVVGSLMVDIKKWDLTGVFS